MKWFLGSGVVIAAMVAMGLWFYSGETPKATREGPIVAFGDSLVYGTGSSGGGFVKILEGRIGEPITNLGVPGETTADGLKRIESVVALKPSVVILLLGGNDYLRRVPHDEAFANLATIIERLQTDGATVLLIGVRGGILRDNFAARYEDLANQYDVAYVHDVLEDTLGNDQYMSDQIHPNDTGYRLIADRIEPVLREMLK